MRNAATTLESEMHDEESSCLYQLLRSEKLPNKHLEIGTAAGGTLKGLMQCYTNDDRPQFVVVDPMTYFPDQLQLVEKNLSQGGLNPDDVDFRIGVSTDLFEKSATENERFSFILIDGSHKARYVMQDLRWTRLLDVGGIVCLHDYTKQTKGVMTSTDRFLKNNKNYQVINHVESLIVLKKIAAGSSAEVSLFDLAAAHLTGFIHQIQSSIQKRLRKL
jgi:predicted O-methyltransferase YrrM